MNSLMQVLDEPKKRGLSQWTGHPPPRASAPSKIPNPRIRIYVTNVCRPRPGGSRQLADDTNDRHLPCILFFFPPNGLAWLNRSAVGRAWYCKKYRT